MRLPTPRLLLREFEDADWQRVHEYQSDPAYHLFNPWDERTEADVQALMQRFIEWQHEQPRSKFQLAIHLRSEDKLIGSCGVRSTSGDMIEAELGFELDKDYWGKGYATEACRALIEFAFMDLHVSLLVANCVQENQASAQVLRRLGMHYVRSERNGVWIRGTWMTTDSYSINLAEWRASHSS
jgi:ribosomal-protein-alanine N-acetyltransferase